MVNNITDADLFLHYLNTNATVTWSDDQIKAATGYPTVTTLSTPEVRNGIFSASPDNHLVFELPEPAFDEALAVTGGVIFGLSAISPGVRFPDREHFRAVANLLAASFDTTDMSVLASHAFIRIVRRRECDRPPARS